MTTIQLDRYKNLPAHIFFVGILIIQLVGCTTAGADTAAKMNLDGSKELVVLLHGLARSKTAMWRLASRIEEAGYAVARIGYRSLDVPPEEILQNIGRQIDLCCVKHPNTIHFVGHSLGGLLIRAYLDKRRPDQLGKVVLIGTPNQGTPIVDYFQDRWYAQFAGPTARALGTGKDSFPNSLPPPHYLVGVIAGVVESLNNEKYIPGKDDGLVPVESTKLKGMTDFILVETSHSMMRYNKDVATQTLYFLKQGKFSK